MSKIDVVAHIHAKQEHADAVRAVLESYLEPTRKENGCLRYDLFADVSDPAKFTFLEEWESREALEQHGRSAHIQAGKAKVAELLREPTWVQLLTGIV